MAAKWSAFPKPGPSASAPSPRPRPSPVQDQPISQSFRHAPLKEPSNFIRLLQVQGGASSAQLSLRITQFALHRRPPYLAISYTWGLPTAQSYAISVNGKPFSVRHNLYHLLWHLRQRGESRFLWIDALCIDQGDLVERNFHVGLMGRIYSDAQGVVVWLGLPSDDRRQARALEFISEMTEIRRKDRTGGQAWVSTYLGEKMRARWLNLIELCCGVYWTRTWIIQEFLHAQVVEVLCGTAALQWTEFEDLISTLRTLSLSGSAGSASWPDFIPQFLATLPVRLTLRRLNHTPSTLLSLLSEFHDSQCAVRRDKIYGILGIADDVGTHPETGDFIGPKPDYGKHIVEVYFEVLDYLRPKREGDLLRLDMAQLAIRALNITPSDIESYVAMQQILSPPTKSRPGVHSGLESKLLSMSLQLTPAYTSPILELTPWVSAADLRRRLSTVDWSAYVGHEVRRKVSRNNSAQSQRNPSSSSSTSKLGPGPIEHTLAPLPGNLISNVLRAAEFAEELNYLNNTPASSARIPVGHIMHHSADKRTHNNPTYGKPPLIIESNPSRGIEPVRLGFACSDARVGDLICQFEGTDVTLIARRELGGLRVIGKALMVTHSGLTETAKLDGSSPEWSGVVVPPEDMMTTTDEGWTMETDPFSVWELVGRG